MGLSLFTSCDDNDDKFSGTPVGVMPIETIQATVSTNTDFALLGQTIKFTATLPSEFRNLTLQDTVTVEASTITLGGSLRKGTVDILPGDYSAEGEIVVGGGGGAFDLTFDLKLTAISLKHEIQGKHYLIDSNTLTIASGNSSVPAENDSRLQIRVTWQNLTAPNVIRSKIVRPSGTETFMNAEGSPITGRFYFVSKKPLLNAQGNIVAEGTNYGYTAGTYKVKIGVNGPSDLVTDPIDLKYRVIVRFPNQDVRTFNGVYYGLTGTSPFKDVLQFTKTGIDENALFTDFVNLNP